MNDDNIDKYIDLSLYCNKKFGILDFFFQRDNFFFNFDYFYFFQRDRRIILDLDFFFIFFLRDRVFKFQIIFNFLEVQEVVC